MSCCVFHCNLCVHMAGLCSWDAVQKVCPRCLAAEAAVSSWCLLLPSSPACRRALLCFPLQARGPGQQSAVGTCHLPLSNPPAATGCLVPPCRPEAGLGATAGAAGLLLAGLRGFHINGERRRQLYVLCAMCSCFAGLMPNAMIAVLLVLELGGWVGGWVGGQVAVNVYGWAGRMLVSGRAGGRRPASACCNTGRPKRCGPLRAWPLLPGCCTDEPGCAARMSCKGVPSLPLCCDRPPHGPGQELHFHGAGVHASPGIHRCICGILRHRRVSAAA